MTRVAGATEALAPGSIGSVALEYRDALCSPFNAALRPVAVLAGDWPHAQTDTIEDSGDGIEALGVLGDGLIRRAFVIDENNRTQAIFFSLMRTRCAEYAVALESVTLQLFEGESRAPLVEVVGNAADMVLALAQGKDYRLAVVSAPQSRPLISLAIDIQSLEVPLVGGPAHATRYRAWQHRRRGR